MEMTLGERIKSLRKAKTWTQARLAAEVEKIGGELSQPQVSAIENDEVDRPGSLPELAAVFGLTPLELLGDETVTPSQPNGHTNAPLDVHVPPPQSDDQSPLPLVLYRTAPGERGRQEGFMLIAERSGEVERPEFLRFSKQAFSNKVLDDKNYPAYRVRDIVLVDPDSPRIEGEDHLFTGDLTPSPGRETFIGCLVRETAALWIIKQYNVRGERELSRAQFPHAWPIVGRYNRR